MKKMYCCDFLLLMNEIFFVVNYYTLQNTQLHTRKKIHTHMTQYRKKYRKMFHFQAIQVNLLVILRNLQTPSFAYTLLVN